MLCEISDMKEYGILTLNTINKQTKIFVEAFYTFPWCFRVTFYLRANTFESLLVNDVGQIEVFGDEVTVTVFLLYTQLEMANAPKEFSLEKYYMIIDKSVIQLYNWSI